MPHRAYPQQAGERSCALPCDPFQRQEQPEPRQPRRHERQRWLRADRDGNHLRLRAQDDARASHRPDGEIGCAALPAARPDPAHGLGVVGGNASVIETDQSIEGGDGDQEGAQGKPWQVVDQKVAADQAIPSAIAASAGRKAEDPCASVIAMVRSREASWAQPLVGRITCSRERRKRSASRWIRPSAWRCTAGPTPVWRRSVGK